MKKSVAAVILILACLVLGYFIAQSLTNRKTSGDKDALIKIETEREQISDSIFQYSEREQLHRDSAQFYHEKVGTSFKKYAAVMADSALWDSLRAKYSRDLKDKIRSGSTGQRDPVRIP